MDEVGSQGDSLQIQVIYVHGRLQIWIVDHLERNIGRNWRETQSVRCVWVIVPSFGRKF